MIFNRKAHRDAMAARLREVQESRRRLSAELLRKELAVMICDARRADRFAALTEIYRGLVVNIADDGTLTINGQPHVVPPADYEMGLETFAQCHLRAVVWPTIIAATPPEVLNYWA